jgi:hypothetical protein
MVLNLGGEVPNLPDGQVGTGQWHGWVWAAEAQEQGLRDGVGHPRGDHLTEQQCGSGAGVKDAGTQVLPFNQGVLGSNPSGLTLNISNISPIENVT